MLRIPNHQIEAEKARLSSMAICWNEWCQSSVAEHTEASFSSVRSHARPSSKAHWSDTTPQLSPVCCSHLVTPLRPLGAESRCPVWWNSAATEIASHQARRVGERGMHSGCGQWIDCVGTEQGGERWLALQKVRRRLCRTGVLSVICGVGVDTSSCRRVDKAIVLQPSTRGDSLLCTVNHISGVLMLSNPANGSCGG